MFIMATACRCLDGTADDLPHDNDDLPERLTERLSESCPTDGLAIAEHLSRRPDCPLRIAAQVHADYTLIAL